MPVIKKAKYYTCCWECGETSVGGNENWFSQYEYQCRRSSSKNRTTIWPHNSASAYILEGNENRLEKGICALVFVGALVTIAGRYKHPSDHQRIKS